MVVCSHHADYLTFIPQILEISPYRKAEEFRLWFLICRLRGLIPGWQVCFKQGSALPEIMVLAVNGLWPYDESSGDLQININSEEMSRNGEEV